MLAALLAGGCSSPTRTAQALDGCWENGPSRLIISKSGLYGLSLDGHKWCGPYGLPSTNQLLLQQEGSHFPQRTLWTITVSDNDTLDSTTADKKAIQWKRKSLAPLDRKLVGVWKSQTALDKVSFVEITAQSGFISCRWLKRHKKFHRVCNAGILTVGKGFLTVNTGGSKSLDIPYKLSDDSLKLTFGKQESSYSKTSEPEKLITEFP